MHYYEIAPTAIIRSTSAWFTYHSVDPLAIGSLVTISVGKKILPAVVLHEVSKPSYDTKPIESLIEPLPLPTPLVATARWMSDYYTTHLATTLQTILPRGITKNRRKQTFSVPVVERNRTKIVFTDQQSAALTAIREMSPGTALLHGITGSGKTRVYVELARETLARGESAIVLIPEISLTSQIVAEFAQHFSDIIVTHSRQTEAERHAAFKEALHSEQPRIVIGPRSALFLPIARVGLIVIDECHEPSFKQEQSPRYSALRVASVLATQHGAKLILGSATPAVADYYLAEQSNRPIITMDQKAAKDTVKPHITLVDMTKRAHFSTHRFFSNDLQIAIKDTLEQKKQVLLFHNRRGSASVTLCEHCGWQAMCPRCFVPLTLHTDKHHLRCHVCGLTERVPTSCPECHHAEIIHKGIGTKMIESEITQLFPQARVRRFDGDTDSDLTLEKQYQALYDGDVDIIIGTQVIAKGLDLPHLRTVGVIQADSGLSLPDYTSSERVFQLLAQVVGRVGRSHHSTRVIVQSYQPEHPAVVHGLAQNYADFYRLTLAERKKGYFPPFSYLLKLTCVYKTEAAAIRNAQSLARTLRAQLPKTVQLLGPTPSFYERQGDTYRWQLTLKSSRRPDLVTLLSHLPAKNWQYELDSISLL